MRWVKLLFWCAAWGVWVWLGVGLYRELPRDIGPVVLRLALEDGERPLGLMPGERSFVTRQVNRGTTKRWIRRRSVSTGAVELAISDDHLPSSFTNDLPLLHNCAITSRSPRQRGGPPGDAHVLDLLTGEWRRCPEAGRLSQVHYERPWASFFWYREGARKDVVNVFDLKTGKRVFFWSGGQSEEAFELVSEPFFVGGDRVAIPVRERARAGKEAVDSIEIWSIEGGKLVARCRNLVPGDYTTASDAGLLVWYDMYRKPHQTQCFDAMSGRTVLDLPRDPLRRGGELASDQVPPLVARDGTAVLSPMAGGIYEVGTGRRLWTAAAHERVRAVRRSGVFECQELWTLGLLGASHGFQTYAVRRMNDGALQWRCWRSTLGWYEANGEMSLMIVDESTIRRLPPRVDWLVLGVCQFVLALPLALLWGLLWWRRRRRAAVT